MPWRGPRYVGEFPSLGWDIADWAEAHFVVPDGPLAGQPLRLTDEQAQILVRFYALTDTGRWVYRRAAVRRAQGWGKSPLLAVVALAELAGPTRFAGWSADGEPVGRRPTAPWVQIAAVSEDQTENTYAALYEMAVQSDLHGPLLDVGRTRLHLQGEPGILEPVTAAAGTRLGQRVTFAVLDEPHLWTKSNGGHKLAATIRRNAAKMGGRTFESTNAHLPGEDSVAEKTYEAHQQGAAGLLYDSVEPEPVEDLHDRAAVLAALRVAYGDASWVDLERIADDIADPSTAPEDARRFYLNQLVAGVDQFVDTALWDFVGGGDPIKAGDQVALGFDGSKGATTQIPDWTVLVGCRLRDGKLFVVDSWHAPDDGWDTWQPDRKAVTARVLATHKLYRVERAHADPPGWETELETWQRRTMTRRRGKKQPEAVWYPFETYRPKQMGMAIDRFETAVRAAEVDDDGHLDADICHDGNPDLASHIGHARRTEDRSWTKLTKPDQRSKIDLAVAAVLAYDARCLALAAGLLDEKPRSGRAVFI